MASNASATCSAAAGRGPTCRGLYGSTFDEAVLQCESDEEAAGGRRDEEDVAKRRVSTRNLM
ncbi:hypothetical protein ACP70R_039507 [Stipagrostis hirtigluma subsp. patula]